MDVFEQVNDVGVAVKGALGDVDGVEQGLDLVGFEGFADGLRPLDQEVPGLGAGCPGGKLGDVFDAVCLGVFHDDGGAEAFFEVHRVYCLTMMSRYFRAVIKKYLRIGEACEAARTGARDCARAHRIGTAYKTSF